MVKEVEGQSASGCSRFPALRRSVAWSTLHSSRRHLPPPREVQHNHHRLHAFSRMSLSSWRERAGLRANHAPPLLARTKPWTGSSFVYRRHHVPQPPRPPRTFDEWGGISPRNAASFPRGMFCISAGGGGTGPQRIGKRKSPNRAIGLGKTRLAKIGMEWIFSGHHW